MARRVSLLVIAALALFWAFKKVVGADSVSEELAVRSRADGLGLTWYEGVSRLGVKRFDRPESSDPLVIPGLSGLYDVNAASGLILGAAAESTRTDQIASRDFLAPHFAVFFLDGTEPLQIGLRHWPRAASISPHRKWLAVLTVDARTHVVSLQYGDVSWQSPQTVYTLDLGDDAEHLTVVNYVEDNFSWSDDDRWLVYSKQKHIYLFDAETQMTRVVGNGADPSWSPDGKMIAYRSDQGRLMVAAPDGSNARSLLDGVVVVSVPRWSPRSEYILCTRFSQHRADLNLMTHDATDFVAVRVADGASTVIFEPHNGEDNRRYFWVLSGRRN